MSRAFKAVVVLGLLLTAILTVSSCGSSSNDKLLAAIKRKDVEAVREIVATGVDLKPLSGLHDVNKPLPYAAAYGNLEIVKLLVKAGAPLNGKVAHGDVALIKADEHSNNDIIEYLIKQGADVNVANEFGITPFIGLCGGGHLPHVELAAKHGGDVHSSFVALIGEGTGKKNFSPLQAASSYGRLEVVKLLLSLGADPQEKFANGRNSIELAESEGHKDVAELLRKHSESAKQD